MYGKHMKMSERLAEVAKISPSCCLYDKIYDAVFLPLYRSNEVSVDSIHRYILSSVRWHKYNVVNFIILATGFNKKSPRQKSLLYLKGTAQNNAKAGPLSMLKKFFYKQEILSSGDPSCLDSRPNKKLQILKKIPIVMNFFVTNAIVSTI